jgi:iron(III) transport system permease protein
MTLSAKVELSRLSRFRWLREPEMIVWALMGLVMVVLVAGPLVKLAMVSFQNDQTGALTFDNFARAFGTPRHLRALFNTAGLGIAVTALSAVFAIPLAWAVSRTDMPGRQLVKLTAFAAFVTPPYLLAVAWILLAGPNAGWLNRLWIELFGATSGPLNIFSFTGLTVIMAAHLFYFIFIFALNAFDLLSSEMEEAASIIGAGRWYTLRRITLPLILPALLAGSMIVFLQAIALFAVPALISLPAGIPLLTMQLWEFFEFPVRVGTAAAYSLPLVAVTAGLLWLQRRLIGRRGYASVSGKGGERRIMRLGRWKWVMFLYAMIVCCISVYFPMVVLTQAAFAKAWGRGFSFSNLTFDNFYYVLFEHSSASRALVNSIVFGSASAILSVGLAFVAAYMVERKLVPFPKLVALLCVVPVVVPGIVLAIGFYAVYGAAPLSLYGTPWILILAFTTRFLPISYSNVTASLKSINEDLELAVRTLGGSRATGIRRIVAPLLKRSLIGVGILVFVPASQELSTAILLTGPNTRVLSVVLLGMSEEGNLEALSALGAILLIITVAVLWVGQRLLGRDFMTRGA